MRAAYLLQQSMEDRYAPLISHSRPTLADERYSMSKKERALNRGLRERHIRLMALGSTIGVGLFLGSASAIKLAGPAILLSYVLGGIAIFIIMRALGEMAV